MGLILLFNTCYNGQNRECCADLNVLDDGKVNETFCYILFRNKWFVLCSLSYCLHGAVDLGYAELFPLYAATTIKYSKLY